jgi:magnesium-transporting ATPase (P-type)
MESFDDIMAPRFAMVKREGHFREVFVDEVVVGDLVKLVNHLYPLKSNSSLNLQR